MISSDHDRAYHGSLCNIRGKRSLLLAEVSCSDLLSVSVVETSKPKSILKTTLSVPESPSTCENKIDSVSHPKGSETCQPGGYRALQNIAFRRRNTA